MAPAYTPALWLAGIGLIGDTLNLAFVPHSPWVYWGVSGLFLVFHNLHTGLVYARRLRSPGPPPAFLDHPRVDANGGL